jgi:hypothetical protein
MFFKSVFYTILYMAIQSSVVVAFYIVSKLGGGGGNFSVYAKPV